MGNDGITWVNTCCQEAVDLLGQLGIVIPTSQEQLEHVSVAIMTGSHYVFPTDLIDSDDPISKKKLPKGEGQYSLLKTLLGFDFDSKRKTMWLEEEKRAKLLTILLSWH
jgi:hypothetical protein